MLPDDESIVISRLIEFLYTGKYKDLEPEIGQSISEKTMTTIEEHVESEFTLHAKMYAVAVKYGVADLDQTVKSRFRSLASKA